MSFSIAFSNVLLTLLYIVPGFAACKAKIAKAEHLPTLSSILVYICSPCMIISSFMQTERTWQNTQRFLLFFLISFLLQAVSTGIIYFILHKKYDDVRYRMLTASFGLGNAGFFGIPIIKSLLPNNPEVAAFACVYVVGMNIITFTVGVYCLTGNRRMMTLKKAFVNPSVISMAIALMMFALNMQSVIPQSYLNAIDLLGKITTPLCMIILGIRLAAVPFKKLFMRPFVYVICGCKLLVFPIFCLIALYFLPLDYVFKATMFILCGTPCAAVMLNLAEIYHGERELAANCVLLSTLLCVVTIPILTLILGAVM